MIRSATDVAARSWIVLGGPQGGTVLAVAVARDTGQTAFAATEVGVYRAQLNESHDAWHRLVDLPGTPTALAFSPAFEQDNTVLIGTTIGPMVSHNGGTDFRLGRLPRSSTHVVALALSPNFLQDGVVFAGTLEDGVLVSQDRGQSWAAWNFGLFELEIVSLALSPNFARDATALIGTTSGLYYSYNGGRAWREVEFPSEAQPILSLAFSPNTCDKTIVFAGTESAGLYQGIDPLTRHAAPGPNPAITNGTTLAQPQDTKGWQSLVPELGSSCINALVFDERGSLYAATENGIFVSRGEGRWETALDVRGALCLALNDGIGIAGIGYQGEPEVSGLSLSTYPASGSITSPALDEAPL